MPPEKIYRYNVVWMTPEKRAVQEYWAKKMREELDKIPREGAPSAQLHIVHPREPIMDRIVMLAIDVLLWITSPFTRTEKGA